MPPRRKKIRKKPKPKLKPQPELEHPPTADPEGTTEGKSSTETKLQTLMMFADMLRVTAEFRQLMDEIEELADNEKANRGDESGHDTVTQ